MIKMQWLPLILKGKSEDKAVFCLYEEIYFKISIYLDIYIYIIFELCYLADAFIQSDLKMRPIEAIKTNKRAIICNKVLY